MWFSRKGSFGSATTCQTNLENFEVWLQAWDCDGNLSFGPELVSVDAEVNHTVPRLAVGDETVMLIWQSDDGSGNQNLSISVPNPR